MFSLLLAVIFMAFISLGLGDSLLGSAWPVMHGRLGVPIAYAGIVSMTIAAGTITSSLLSDRLVMKLGTRLVVILSVCVSAIALFGFSLSGTFLMICLLAFPYGIGAGALDVTVNNYVAVNYKSRHMNWLHCFWGVGAMAGPYIMGFYLTRGFEWTAGYRTVAIIQMIFIAILLISFRLWKKGNGNEANRGADDEAIRIKSFSEKLNIKGVKFVLIAFFAYCAIEATTILWASTFLVGHRGMSAEIAAGFASLFFIGITVGRFVSGIVSAKIGNEGMIKLGISLVFVGIVAVFMPMQENLVSFIGLIVIGLGCAPIFPSIIHLTPKNFGHENSQGLVGLQMASAYTGSALMPPMFGLMASFLGIGIFPVFLFVFAVLFVVMMTALSKALRA